MVIKKLNYDFALLAILVLLINYPYLKATFVPVHDTMAAFQYFYFFYSELFFHGQIPHWVPYGTFGLQSDHFQLGYLTPFSYFAFLIGLLFKIKNVLFLFKISILCEQLIFLLGMYLLSMLLFFRRSTVFIVCLGAVCSLVWYGQVGWNFRIYYMFPLITYFIILFFRTSRPEFMWLAGITTVAWWIGGGSYAIILLFFVLCIICFVFLMKYKNVWHSFFSRSSANLLLSIIFIVLFGSYIYYLKPAFDFTSIISPLRDSATHKNSLQTFLTYGGNATPEMLFQGFIFGWPTHLPLGTPFIDNSVYIGLVPLVFLVWALLRVRSIPFFAFLSAAIALIWLSFGGFFARIVYYFPFMPYFRHIGLICSFAKILILICAGFGLDDFWSAARTKNKYLIFVILIIFILLLYMFPHLQKGILNPIFITRVEMYFAAVILALILRILMFIFNKIKVQFITDAAFKNLVKMLLIFVFLFDILSFQFVVYKQSPKLPTSYYPFLDSVIVNELKFQETRTEEPAGIRQQHALGLITYPNVMTICAHAYNFLQFDPCFPSFRADLLSLGVDRLFKFKIEDKSAFLRVLGCNYPKLRLVSKAVFVDTVEDAARAISQMSSLDDVVILRGIGKTQIPNTNYETTQDLSGKLNVTKFTSNEVIVDANLTTEAGAWLVYADAFHPGWRATVNGRKAAIAEAYLAFKAVKLEKGHSVVRFWFYNGLSSLSGILIVLFSVIVSVLFFLAFLGTVFFKDYPVVNKSKLGS